MTREDTGWEDPLGVLFLPACPNRVSMLGGNNRQGVVEALLERVHVRSDDPQEAVYRVTIQVRPRPQVTRYGVLAQCASGLAPHPLF